MAWTAETAKVCTNVSHLGHPTVTNGNLNVPTIHIYPLLDM